VKLKFKICGIKTLTASKVVCKYKADFLGFNFVPTSKRLIGPSAAQKIINSLPKTRRPIMVGVFQNQSRLEVKSILSKVKLNMLQFHGKEDRKFCESFSLPYIKAFGLDNNSSIGCLSKKMNKYKPRYFLLDRSNRGKGSVIDLKKVTRLAKQFPVLLAGGLNPQNISSIISKTGNIKGVDVAGGVETAGKKDHAKIKDFLMKSRLSTKI